MQRYNHKFVESKRRVREQVREGKTDIQYFKEYDEFLAELCKWLEEKYDKTVSMKENKIILHDKLQEYKLECARNIQIFFKKSGLKEKGYRLQNQTSVKYPLLLRKYLIFHKDQYGIQECVAQGTYEQIVNWINNETEVKNKNE